MASDYTVDKIKIMEGLDAVRMRPGMYIGSTGQRGLHHSSGKSSTHSIDEAANGYANEISVTLHKDNSVTVTDNGRGIPCKIHEKAGVSGVEVVFTQLHAGGKFGNDSYGYSGGLHGVGASVVNALSEWLKVEVCTDGRLYGVEFRSEADETGKIISGKTVAPLTELGRTRKQGTTITFMPDERVFETVEMNFDVISRRLRELAYLNRGTKMVLSDEHTDTSARRNTSSTADISDFVCYLNGDKTPLFSTPIHFSGASGDILVEVAIQYNDGYADNIFSYVNNIPTPRAARTKRV
jgi:DNA gyrase subunit B